MATETFTGTNGATWSGWTTYNAATIQGNKGRLADSTGGFATGWWSSSSPVTDFDLTLTFATSGAAFARIGVAATQTINWFVPDNGVIALLRHNGTGVYSVQTLSYPPGSEISYAEFSAIAPGPSGYRFRMQRAGSTIRSRVWADGAAEPSTWTSTGTDPNAAGATDRVWLTGSDAGGAGWVDFDDVTIGAIAATSSPAPGRRQSYVPRRRAANW